MYDLVIASALQGGWIELDIEPLLGNEKLFFGGGGLWELGRSEWISPKGVEKLEYLQITSYTE